MLTALAGRTDAENATPSLPVMATDPDGDTLTYSATGLPGGLAINPTTGAITGTLTYTSAGTHPVIVTATDPELAASSRSFAWTVTNLNQVPVLTALAGRTDAENAIVALPLAATDPDGDALTYSATGLPGGLAIHPTTGTITGTLTYTSAGTHPITVTATDPDLAIGSQTFTWTVTNVNQAPTLTDVPDRSDPEHTLVTIPLAGADLDADTTLTYSAAPLPTGMTINPATGLISGTLTYASAGSSTVTVSVSDGTASAAQTFTWTVTNVNQPPTLTDVPDRTDPENTLVAISLAGTDPDPGTTLTYSATPLPAGISVNTATGLISGTLTYASAGTSSVTVSVSDGTASADQTFTWTVTNVNQPPTLTDVPDRTDPENTLVAIPLAGADLDPGTTLTYSATGLPAGLSVDASTGLISGTFGYTSAGAHAVIATVSDGDLTSSQTFTWTVTNVNQSPVLTALTGRTDAENATVSLPVVATDPDGDALTFSATGLPGGLAIDAVTGTITRDAGSRQCRAAHGHRHRVGWGARREPDLHVDGHQREPRAGHHGHRRPDERRERDGDPRDQRHRSRRGCADLQRDGAPGGAGNQRDHGGDHRDADLHECRDAPGHGDGDRHRISDQQHDLHVDGGRREPRAGADRAGAPLDDDGVERVAAPGGQRSRR